MNLRVLHSASRKLFFVEFLVSGALADGLQIHGRTRKAKANGERLSSPTNRGIETDRFEQAKTMGTLTGGEQQSKTVKTNLWLKNIVRAQIAQIHLPPQKSPQFMARSQ